MKAYRIRVLALLLTGLAAQSLTCSAQVILYRETFGNSGGASSTLGNAAISWASLIAASTGANTQDGTANLGLSGSSSGLGRPNNLDNVNAGTSQSLTNGYAFNQGTQGLLYTNEFSINQSTFPLSSVSWYSNRNTGAAGVQTQNLAVQIGGQWYITTPPVVSNLPGSATGFDTSATLFTVNPNTATWNLLTATVGSPFVVGSSATLPGGTITGFGIYYDLGTNALLSRFDTFEITVVPEPTAITGLLGVAACGLLVLRRRRA